MRPYWIPAFAGMTAEIGIGYRAFEPAPDAFLFLILATNNCLYAINSIIL